MDSTSKASMMSRFFDIAVVLDADACTRSVGDLAGVLLEPTQRTQAAVWTTTEFANQSHMRPARDLAVDHRAAGHRPRLADVERPGALGPARIFSLVTGESMPSMAFFTSSMAS